MRKVQGVVLVIVLGISPLCRGQDQAAGAAGPAPPPPGDLRQRVPPPVERNPEISDPSLSAPDLAHSPALAYDPYRHHRYVVGYEVRPRWGLIAGGIVLFAIPYTVSLVSAAVNSTCDATYPLGFRSALWPLAVPVAGPFIQMGYVHGPGAGSADALLTFDGLLQGAGVAMIIVGATVWKTRPVFAGRAGRVRLWPTAGPASTGLAGNF